jgi:WhiB family transcriptional regulator, redox-sensing transcriptional regulator
VTWRLSWSRQAACHDVSDTMFYPERGRGMMLAVKAAKRICAGCPVRRPCLNYALANDERHGIWGGLSEPERRKLKRRVT